MDAAGAGEHVTHATPSSPAGGKVVFVAPPTAATVADDNGDYDDDKDESRCLQRLHSTPEITHHVHQISHRHHHDHQQRSFSTVTESFTVLSSSSPAADVGGVSVRSAPDSAVPVRQPEVVPGHMVQRSKFQRFFEPLKRSKSAGNQKDVVSATQASLYDPTRQHIPVQIHLYLDHFFRGVHPPNSHDATPPPPPLSSPFPLPPLPAFPFPFPFPSLSFP